jgi:hypothetical protein
MSIFKVPQTPFNVSLILQVKSPELSYLAESLDKTDGILLRNIALRAIRMYREAVRNLHHYHNDS